MKLKKIAQVIVVSCGFLALAACSSMGKHGGANGVDANGVQVAGAGQDDGFGDQNSQYSKRVYYFEFDRSEARDQDKPAIAANADYLVAHQQMRTILEGHTDPRGSREYNVALGERRANSVYNLLKARGVNPDQVRVVSYGAERPAVAGHNEEDYQQDRRAVIVYSQN